MAKKYQLFRGENAENQKSVQDPYASDDEKNGTKYGVSAFILPNRRVFSGIGPFCIVNMMRKKGKTKARM